PPAAVRKRTAPDSGGTFDGHARYRVVPEGDFDADVTLDRIPLGTALNMMPDLARRVRGTGSGKFRAHAPAGHVQDVAAWRASGSLRSPLVEAYAMRLKDAAVDLNLDKGVATLTGLKGDLQGTPLTGSAELRLTGDYPYRVRLSVAKFNLALLERLAPQFRPPFPVKGGGGFNGDLRAALRPFTIKANGKARASALVVNGVRVDSLSFDVADDPKGLRLTHIDARLYKGEVTGSALLPVDKRESGAVNLDVEDVD